MTSLYPCVNETGYDYYIYKKRQITVVHCVGLIQITVHTVISPLGLVI